MRFVAVVIVVLILGGLVAPTSESRQLSWSIAAAIYVVATLWTA